MKVPSFLYSISYMHPAAGISCNTWRYFKPCVWLQITHMWHILSYKAPLLPCELPNVFPSYGSFGGCLVEGKSPVTKASSYYYGIIITDKIEHCLHLYISNSVCLYISNGLQQEHVNESINYTQWNVPTKTIKIQPKWIWNFGANCFSVFGDCLIIFF